MLIGRFLSRSISGSKVALFRGYEILQNKGITFPSVIYITEVECAAVKQHIKNGYRFFIAAVFYLKSYFIIRRNDLLV